MMSRASDVITLQVGIFIYAEEVKYLTFQDLPSQVNAEMTLHAVHFFSRLYNMSSSLFLVLYIIDLNMASCSYCMTSSHMTESLNLLNMANSYFNKLTDVYGFLYIVSCVIILLFHAR